MRQSNWEELDDALSDAPDPITFRAVCAIVDDADDDVATTVVQTAIERLASWPASTRSFDGVDVYIIGSRCWLLARTATTVDVDAALAQPKLFAIADLVKLGLTGTTDSCWDELRIEAWFPSLKSLSVSCDKFRASTLRQFFHERVTSSLESIELDVVINNTALRSELAEYLVSGKADLLKKLGLFRADLETFSIVASAPPPSLEEYRWGWDDAQFEALEHSPFARQLKVLPLGGKRMGDSIARKLASSTTLTGIESLDLSVNFLTETGAKYLLKAPYAQSLRTLCLLGNPIGDKGVSDIAKGGFSSLENLDCRQVDCGSDGLTALAQSGLITNLVTLNCGQNRIGDRGLVALAEANACRLQNLYLFENKLQDEGLIALSKSPWLRQIRELNLSGNGCGDDGISELFNSDQLANAVTLDLRFNDMTEKSLISIVNSSSLHSLTHLALGGRNLVDSDPNLVAQFATSEGLPRLKSLELWGSGVDDNLSVAVRNLKQRWGRLRVLSLCDASLTDAGLDAISRSTLFSGLWVLRITGNNADFGDEGIRSLARSTVLSSLVELRIDGTDCSWEAMVELANSPLARRLDRVYVDSHEDAWRQSTIIRPALRSFLAHNDK